jgi:hypothetical protein
MSFRGSRLWKIWSMFYFRGRQAGTACAVKILYISDFHFQPAGYLWPRLQDYSIEGVLNGGQIATSEGAAGRGTASTGL